MSEAIFPANDPAFLTGFPINDGKQVVTPVARAAFVHLINPQMPSEQNELKEPKYSVVLLFPPNADFTHLNNLLGHVLVNGKQKFGLDRNAWPPRFLTPWHDQGEKKFDGFQPGCKYISITSSQKPDVVGPDNATRITDTSMIYSGCFVRAVVNAYDWNNKTKGIAFGLVHVQKIADGPALNNRLKAENAFTAVSAPANQAAGAGGLFGGAPAAAPAQSAASLFG